MPSAAERDLQDKARTVPAGTLRHTVLLSAKRFKSTWVELGRLLVQVRDEAQYEAWGYPSFEAYCLKELHLRRPTALKLTRSFGFLSRHEPRDVVQHEDFAQQAPAFEVVEVLADAEERGQLTPDEYRSVREQIWNPERPAAEVKRELSERFPRPPGPVPPEALQVRRLAQAARKLAEGLGACSKVPRAVSERARALAEDVEELATGLNSD